MARWADLGTGRGERVTFAIAQQRVLTAAHGEVHLVEPKDQRRPQGRVPAPLDRADEDLIQRGRGKPEIELRQAGLDRLAERIEPHRIGAERFDELVE